MERFGLDVQDPLRASGGQASRLLDEEGDGVALVQQPQLWREEVRTLLSFAARERNIQRLAVKALCHFVSHYRSPEKHVPSSLSSGGGYLWINCFEGACCCKQVVADDVLRLYREVCGGVIHLPRRSCDDQSGKSVASSGKLSPQVDTHVIPGEAAG